MIPHDHGVAEDCTAACPAWDPASWACPRCGRHRAMAADTEDRAQPVCDECFAGEAQ